MLILSPLLFLFALSIPSFGPSSALRFVLRALAREHLANHLAVCRATGRDEAQNGTRPPQTLRAIAQVPQSPQPCHPSISDAEMGGVAVVGCRAAYRSRARARGPGAASMLACSVPFRSPLPWEVPECGPEGAIRRESVMEAQQGVRVAR